MVFKLALEGLDFKERAGMFFSETRVKLQKLFSQVFLLGLGVVEMAEFLLYFLLELLLGLEYGD